MKARRDAPRILSHNAKLNIMSIQCTTDIDPNTVDHLHAFDPELDRPVLLDLFSLFQFGKTAGSLIRIPESHIPRLQSIKKTIEKGLTSPDLFVSQLAQSIQPIIDQSLVLCSQYDCVVANPPYMGGTYQNTVLKRFLKTQYHNYRDNLFSAFIVRGLELAVDHGYLGSMSPFVWMFISTHESLRTKLIDDATITSLGQLEYSGFSGATVPVCTFTTRKRRIPAYKGSYIRLSDFRGADNQVRVTGSDQESRLRMDVPVAADNFHKIPGSPIAYWASKRLLEIFEESSRLGNFAEAKKGLDTGDNERFLRLWYEVDSNRILFNCHNADQAKESRKKWVPCDKGGKYRKWYGNNDYLINWENEGSELKSFKPQAVIRNEKYYFNPGITWTDISSTYMGVRFKGRGFIFDVSGPFLFCDESLQLVYLAYLVSILTPTFTAILNPTFHNGAGTIAALPVIKFFFSSSNSNVINLASEAVEIAREDWNLFRNILGLQSIPLGCFSLTNKHH